ncbi:hypothetical protein BJF79_19120 [Actinomadura sp. CNU-125]|uniref:hypothetical protein n=1 Tax=Actinomadura sp. CNU-125 TaxID=1904961 RepID=UPI00096537F7|nr:hypothetical protein [Actinomadura sp. CNU-125]OLT14261.1 hypothetical protein BJF79_19120 [Actinomadura sp. CNU-125]
MLAIAVVLAVFWPAMMVWTYTAGEKATATITDCGRITSGGKTTTQTEYCKATWSVEGGGRGEGSVYGQDADTPDGARVPLHIGPMGPYAGGITDQYPLFVPLAVLIVLCGLGTARTVRRAASGRATARELLDAPDGTRLVVTRRKATVPDGGPHAVLRRAEPPDGYTRPAPHGLHMSEAKLLLEPLRLVGKALDPQGIAALNDPSGRPLLFVDHHVRRHMSPEYVLADPSGRTRLVIRRTRWSPRAYTLTDPDGVQVGAVDGRGPGVLEVTDAAGTRVATAACRGRSWALRSEPSAHPLLRDAALVVAFLQYRLGD